MSGEARAASFVRRSRRRRQAPGLSRGMSMLWRSDGHHVRKHPRPARRRARFSAALRPRASHAARGCPSWVLDDCRFSERETLTAPRRARSVCIYVMAGRVAIRKGSRDLQLQAISKVQRSWIPMWSTRRGRSPSALDEAWTMSGRMATTPPPGTVQSTAGDLRRQPCDIGFRQQAERVRSGKHPQRPVLWARII